MTRRDTVFDALTTAVAVLLVLVSVLGPPVNAAYAPAGLAAECATLVLLPLRRRAPLTVAWLVAVVAVVMTVTEFAVPGTVVRGGTTPWIPLATTPFAAYGAWAHGGERRHAWAPVAVLAIIAARPWAPSGPMVTQALLLTAVPGLAGLYVATRQRLVEQALADQRSRLAADLHDTVTHRITLIVLRAGVLGMSARDADTRAAAEDMRASGCQALEELRELVHVVRADTAVPSRSRAPAPELGPLVAESAAAGLRAELDEDGDPATVSPMLRRTAHRIVQESLTNVRKHAPGAEAHVRVRYRREAVHVTISNTAPARVGDPALAGTGSGTGLHNLRQRVELAGGTLDAGPAGDGGFRVAATLPVS
ncbi:histidine kinase [Amycolatopsis sp. NPDC021455]|uniref:sensor histidine kinase n=1 Tax=Amycolatopsis sp. NPDC021455 TaxID=3154901 RepID=UPI0033F1FAFF